MISPITPSDTDPYYLNTCFPWTKEEGVVSPVFAHKNWTHIGFIQEEVYSMCLHTLSMGIRNRIKREMRNWSRHLSIPWAGGSRKPPMKVQSIFTWRNLFWTIQHCIFGIWWANDTWAFAKPEDSHAEMISITFFDDGSSVLPFACGLPLFKKKGCITYEQARKGKRHHDPKSAHS